MRWNALLQPEINAFLFYYCMSALAAVRGTKGDEIDHNDSRQVMQQFSARLASLARAT